MTWVRTPDLPSPALMDGIRPRPVRRVRVVAAMVAVSVAGPLVGAFLGDSDIYLGLIGMVPYYAAIAVVAAAIALRRPSRIEVGWFATLYGVGITARNGTVILDYLARTRRWRAYGVVGSLSAMGGIALAAPGTDVNPWAILFAGWFAGGILGEVPVGRERTGGVRVASLQPRTLSTYLSPGVIGWPVGWTVASAALLVLYGATVSPLGTARILGGFAVVAVVSSLSVWSMLVIVRRPQTAAPPDVLAADDATRRAAVRRIAAGWGALQCIATVVIGSWVSRWSGSYLAAHLGLAAGMLGCIGVLISWLVLPTRMFPARAARDRLVIS